MSSRVWPCEESVPVKFYFYRRTHAVELVAKLANLEVDSKLSQTFSGGQQTWVVVTDWQVLWFGPVLAAWFREAVERWKPSEGKLA